MSKSNKKELSPNFIKLFAKALPLLTVNCIIFRFRKGHLEYVASKVKRSSLWLLPGGFIYSEEDVDAAAQRVLFEDTGITGQRLSQFGLFGASNRNFADILTAENGFADLPPPVANRVSNRSVTIGYYCILGMEEVVMKAGVFFDKVEWLSVNEPIKLGMDHGDLLAAARVKLRSELQSQPVLQSFLPPTFTMPELQVLHEAILDRPIDRGNFRRRMLKNKFLIEVGESTVKTGRRPRKLYCFDEARYLDSLTDEVKLGF